MTSGITVDDREFQRAFRNHLEHLQKQTRAGTRRYAASAVALAQSHINSVSGELAASIKADDHLDEEPPWIEIGAFEDLPEKLRHAVETEFGTSKEDSHPYMRPGLEEARRDFIVEP